MKEYESAPSFSLFWNLFHFGASNNLDRGFFFHITPRGKRFLKNFRSSHPTSSSLPLASNRDDGDCETPPAAAVVVAIVAASVIIPDAKPELEIESSVGGAVQCYHRCQDAAAAGCCCSAGLRLVLFRDVVGQNRMMILILIRAAGCCCSNFAA